jgi:hypothetical protein
MAPALPEVVRLAMRTGRRLRACGLLLVAANVLAFGACGLNPQPLPPGDSPDAMAANPGTGGTGGSATGSSGSTGGGMIAWGTDAGELADAAPLPTEQDASQDGANMEDAASADALVESGSDDASEADVMGDHQ